MTFAAQINHRILGVAIVVVLSIIAVAPARANMTARPTSVNFPNQWVGTTSASLTVTLTNNNEGRTTIDSIATSLAQFPLSAPSLPVTLYRGQSLTVSVRFSPTATQAYSGSLIVNFSNRPAMTIPLGGTGFLTTYAIGAVPATIAFSGQVGGPVPTSQNVTISDTPSGASAFTLSADQPWITLSATSGTAPAVVQFGANPSGLVAGSYSGHVFIAASGVTDSPFAVPVALTVSPAAVGSLQVTTTSLPNGQVGSSYSTTLSASGGTPPYSWSIATGSLPAGLNFSPRASSNQIYGTPTQSGTFPFTIQMWDSGSPGQTATKSLSISVAAGTVSSLQVATSSLAGGQVGSSYSATLAASGGTSPYSWSIASGSLPAGLTLSSSGLLSGTPTVSATSSFTVQATDSSSPVQTASKTLSLAVTAASISPVQITTSSLAGGQVSSNYSSSVAASGGTTPYHWSIASGSLPAGLALGSSSGQISGTPTASGTSSFTVQVQDSSSTPQTASHAFSLAVAAAVTTNGTPLTSCQVLANSGTTYVLQNDVAAQGSCFDIQANNITLNLNGHTITYADPLSTTLSLAPLTSSVFGIYGAASWDPHFNGGIAIGNPTGGSWNNLTVAGPGTITQANCLSPSNSTIGSNAIHIGQGSGDNLSVYSVTFNICADSTQAIYADSNGAGDSIHDNTVNDRVVTAHSRSMYQGVAFLCNGCQNDTGSPSNFYNNTITGGPQGGIVWNNPGTVIYNNTIKQGNPNASPGFLAAGTASLVCGGANANPYINSAGTLPLNAGTQCSNDSAIYNESPGGVVYGNTVQAQEGRGIYLSGACWNPGSCTGFSGQSVHGDTITAQEFHNNSEYDGCELAGAWGLEWRDGPVNSTIYNENVTAISNQWCAAGAFRTQYVSNYNNVSHNNTYTAKRAPGSPSNCTGVDELNCAYAAAFLGAGDSAIPTQFTSQNDTFIADSALLYFDWDASPDQGLMISPTFQKGANPDSNYFHFAVFRNGNGTVAFHVRDAIFGSGVSPTDTDLPAQGANNQAASLYIDWTLTLTVQNQEGNPVSGASVSYRNMMGTQECSATTNGAGLATCILTQYRDNNDTGANKVENHNPFSFTISAPACTTLTGSESITGIATETKKLPGC